MKVSMFTKMLKFCLFLHCLSFYFSEQTAKEVIESYIATFRRDHLHGDVTEVVKGHNQFSCAMICSRRKSCKMGIVDEKNNTCIITTNAQDSLKLSQSWDKVVNGRYLYIQMVRTNKLLLLWS